MSASSQSSESGHVREFYRQIANLPQGYWRTVPPSPVANASVISIARTILMDAPIILLDEVATSLDAENETGIQNGTFAQMVKLQTESQNWALA